MAQHYEKDPETFRFGSYRVVGQPGVALAVLGWEESNGHRTGNVVAVRTQDNRRVVVNSAHLSGEVL